jgi:hypothetical protein
VERVDLGVRCAAAAAPLSLSSHLAPLARSGSDGCPLADGAEQGKTKRRGRPLWAGLKNRSILSKFGGIRRSDFKNC